MAALVFKKILVVYCNK